MCPHALLSQARSHLMKAEHETFGLYILNNLVTVITVQGD